MKKVIIALAVFVMAFGNTSFAQRKVDLKMNPTKNVLNHYGLRDESTLVPQTASWETTDGEEYRTTYTYDEYDFYLIEEMTKVNVGPDWEYFYRITYGYDFAGNVIEMLGELNMGDGWENDAYATFTYDGEELSEVVYQNWDGTWVNDTKEVYNYNGDMTTVLYWDWNGSTWSSDELYTYTRNGNTLELLMQYMQGGAWQNDEKQIMTLNFDEKITEILEQDWVGTSWVNDELTNYNYDGSVFPTKTVKEWNGSAWVDHLRFVYEYDNYGNAKHGECTEMYDGSWWPTDEDIEMVFNSSETSVEYWGSHVDVQFVDLMNLNENAAAMNVSVYPLPAQGEVSIKADGFAKAEIFNEAGQKVMEALSEKVNIATLPTGLYIIKVYDRAGGVASLKMPVK